METTHPIPEWRAIADEIWALVRETARGLKELQESQKATDRQLEATDKQLEELIAENDRGFKELKESQKATDRQIEATGRQMKATDKRIGELGNRFGEMVEYMVIPNLLTQFEELGFTFTKANRTQIADQAHDLFLEVDALLENGAQVMAVEIKSKPSTGDIHDHLERMEKLRRYADLHHDQRVYRGALAGVVFNEHTKSYALKQGLYVIEPSGDTFTITEPKSPYHPREW